MESEYILRVLYGFAGGLLAGLPAVGYTLLVGSWAYSRGRRRGIAETKQGWVEHQKRLAQLQETQETIEAPLAIGGRS